MAKQKATSRILIHSGGALGADYEWVRAALETDSCFCAEIHSFYEHDCHTENLDHARIHRRVHSFESMNREALPVIERAAASLGKNVPTKPYVLNLQLRDYYQVARSEYVFAVSTLMGDMRRVNGGTGWAIECAKFQELPILVFDQNKKWWFSFLYRENVFVPCNGEPPLGFIRSLGVSHITGIGTRNLFSCGREAIRRIL